MNIFDLSNDDFEKYTFIIYYNYYILKNIYINILIKEIKEDY